MSRPKHSTPPRLRWLLAVLTLLVVFGAILNRPGESGKALYNLEWAVEIAAAGNTTCIVTNGGNGSCWGDNALGQMGSGGTGPYSSLGYSTYGITARSGGGNQFCGVDSAYSFRVVCWGLNSSGQLGLPSTGPDLCQVTVPCRTFAAQGGAAVCADYTCATRLEGVYQTASGGAHSCGLTFAGNVKCWGNNVTAQLGDGTYANSDFAVNVPGSNVTSVVAGARHTCYLQNTGTVSCWGRNIDAQLGQGPWTASNATPTQICDVAPAACPGSTLPNVIQITAGEVHTCALTGGGLVYCWGGNPVSQLGSTSTDLCGEGGATCSNRPKLVPGLTGVTQVEAGKNHTCAIAAGGALKCWGWSQWGQIGNGSYGVEATSATPQNVTGLSSGVLAVTAGDSHTCAIVSAHVVKCWGRDIENQLADAPTLGCGPMLADPCAPTPQLVGTFLDGRPTLKMIGPFSAIIGSPDFTINVFGFNFAPGIVAHINGANRPTSFVSETVMVVTVLASDVATYQPLLVTARNTESAVSNARVVPLFNPIAAGKNHACQIKPGGSVECWGDDKHGQLGQGTGGGPPSATPLALTLTNIVQIAAGDDFTCALDSSGALRCWGRADFLQVGSVTGLTCFSGDACAPAPVPVGLFAPVSQVTAGAQHACAVLIDARVECWGRGDSGQLGTGGLPVTSLPTFPQGFEFSVGVDKISAGGDHTCVIRLYVGNHDLYCTGGGAYGQLGDGSTAISVAFGCVAACTEPYRYVSAGNGFTCGITMAGVTKCWGRADSGQLGFTGEQICSAVACSLLPAAPGGIAVGAAQVEAGGTHACSLSSTLGVLCWGSDVFGQLGDGPPSGPGGIAKVQPIGLASGVQSLSLGSDISCSYELSIVSKCWGLNAFRQLGAITFESCAPIFCSTTPIVVGSLSALPPSITSTSPPSINAMGPAFTLNVFGADFTATSVVEWNGSPRSTTFVGNNHVQAAISTADIAIGAPIIITVSDSLGVSNTWAFLVLNLVPTITSLTPSTIVASSGDTLITIAGTGFVPTSEVYFNGDFRSPTYISPTALSFIALAGELAVPGSFPVTVFNPEPGGGFSAPIGFAVSELTLTGVNPSTALAGSANLPITVSGTGFLPGDAIRIHSFVAGTFLIATTYVNATTVTGAIPASALEVSQIVGITVVRGAISTSPPFPFAVNNPLPTVTTLTPSAALAGATGIQLTVKGTGFNGYSVVRWNGATRITSIVNSTELVASIPNTDLAASGAATVTVFNPPLGGGVSNGLTFTISDFTISGIVPSSATAGDPAFTLTVNGASFLPGDIVLFDNIARATTFVNATTLTAQLLASDIDSAGFFQVKVQQGALFSSTAAFTVNNPIPTLVSLSANSRPRGSAGITLTLAGTGFVEGGTVLWNGVIRSTTVLNATTANALVPASDFLAAGTFSVSFSNPTPGGGTSPALPFQVTNPVPTATLLTPNSVLAGFSGTFPISITGTNFVPAPFASTVLWNGSPRATTFVSSTQVIAQITASDLAVAAVVTVQVSNPTPGGGTTASLTFTVNNGIPVLGSLSPPTIAGGSPGFGLIISGSGFVPGSVILWNGSPRPTFFTSSASLSTTISAADVVNASVVLVSVLNPVPGGGPSNALAFSITNPVPIATGLAPRTHIANGKPFTVIVRGSKFMTTSTATFRDSPRLVSYTNATQVGVQLLPSDMASIGSGLIVISNPGPGGGPSVSLMFELKNAVGDLNTGGLHTCSLDLANIPACWGQNENSQLGFVSSSDPKMSAIPVSVPGLTGVSSIAAGAYHTCALTFAGEVRCWGRNTEGQLGDGTVVDKSTPTTVPNLTGVREIEAGNFHTCVRTNTDGVKCWGYNGAGQLGAASADTCGATGVTFACSKAPLQVTGIAEGASLLAAGGDHTCALVTTALNPSQLRCWGANTFGELGNGTRTTAPSPSPTVVTGGQTFVDVAAGSFHTCALTGLGAAFCWGSNGFGQLGTTGGATCGAPSLRAGEPIPPWASVGRSGARAPVGSNDCALSPVPVPGLTAVQQIAGGFGHTCATTNAGAAYCWGWNEYGQLGDGTVVSRATPVIAKDLSFAVDYVSAGTFHSCAITSTGGLRCWGENFSGQLGEGTTQQRASPIGVTNQWGAPVLFSVTPPSFEANTLPVTVTLAGYGFIPGSVSVWANGLLPLTLSEVTSTSLKATIPASVGGSNLQLMAANVGYGDSNPLLVEQIQIIITARISGTARLNGQPAPNGSVVTVRVAGLPAPTTPPLATVSGGQFSFAVSDPTGGGFRSITTADLFVDGVLAAKNVPVTSGANSLQLFAATSLTLFPGASDGTWFGTPTDPTTLPAAVSAVFEWDNASQRFAFWFRGFPANFQTLGSIMPGHHYFFQSQSAGALPMSGGTFALSQPGGAFSTVPGATGAHWTGNPQPSLDALPLPISAVFQWSSGAQQFRFWFRGFPAAFNTLTGGLQYGSFSFFQASQPTSVSLP